MTDHSTEVWLFYPKGHCRSIRNAMELRCRDRGWSYVERPTFPTRLSTGRPIEKMNPEDATSLYRSIHTKRIGVWQVGNAHAPVRPNPVRNPKQYVRLSRFVRYKAFHCRIDPSRFSEHWEESAIAFQSWIGGIGCEGEGDPRCLPFHVFKTDYAGYDLDTQSDRQQFAQHHGSQSSRRDDNRLLWDRPYANQMHGQPVLQVAGRDLIRGFHWDVSPQRGSQTVATTSEVWKIKRKGYVNIYPNAHIRGSKYSSRVYPR